MKKKTITGAIALSFIATTAFAADFDGKSDLLCTGTEVYECDAANTCLLLSLEETRDIRHLKVDMHKKTVVLDGIQSNFSSKIDRVETIDGKLVLQGIEDGRPERNDDGGGWTMSIDATYGNMVFTQAGSSYAFVGFGNCVAK